MNFLKDMAKAGQMQDMDRVVTPCIWLEIIVWCKKGILLIKNCPLVPHLPMMPQCPKISKLASIYYLAVHFVEC